MTLRGTGAAGGLALAILAGVPVPGSAQGPTTAGNRFSPPDAPEPASASDAPTTIKAIPDSFSEAVGTWDLSLDGTNRRCTIVLSMENGKNGRIVRFPAGCRRALPVLGHVAGWIFADRSIRLIDENIRPILKFAARADQSSLFGKADAGGTYSLVPLQTIGMLPADATPAAATPPATEALGGIANLPEPGRQVADISGAQAIPGSQPVLRADSLTAASSATPPSAVSASTLPIPGVYALDRFNEKDVCRIELGPRPQNATSEKTVAAVRILPGCKDSGISVFDPVAWRFANGHMTLKARKGHAVNLVATVDGTWRRDPDVGTTFVLRRVE